MKLDRRNIVKSLGVAAAAPVALATAAGKKATPAGNSGDSAFSFAFVTDAHVAWRLGQVRERELPAERDDLLEAPYVGYQRGLDKVMKHGGIEFVLTGGDGLELVPPPDRPVPPLNEFMASVEGCVARMKQIEKTTGVPFFNTLGNHDSFDNPPSTPDNPLFGPGLFEKYLGYKGRSYYSFDWKGWHFVVLSTHDKLIPSGHWYGISDQQIAWLEKDLAALPAGTPIVVSAHVPFPQARGVYVEDRKKVLPILKKHNVKLMLFGHQHAFQAFDWEGIPCVTGSSFSGAVWSGARAVRDTTFGGKTAEHSQGYLILSVDGDQIDWRYFPYNFDIEKYHYEQTRIKPYGVSLYWHNKQMKKLREEG